MDPCTYGKGTSTLYEFFWDTDRQNVGAYKYQYDMATGTILDPDNKETVYANSSSGKDNDAVMNRLSDIMENVIVVGDIEDGHTYYKTKGGGTIKVEGTELISKSAAACRLSKMLLSVFLRFMTRRKTVTGKLRD